MEFKEKLLNLKHIYVTSNKSNHASLINLKDNAKEVFLDEKIQNELNENIYLIEELPELEFLVDLIDCIVENFTWVEFSLIETISKLNIFKFLRVDICLLNKFLQWLPSDPKIIFDILENLSENYFYNKLVFSIEKEEFLVNFNEYLKMLPQFSKRFEAINEKLNALTIEKCLENFQQTFLPNNGNIENLLEDQNFFKDLKFISMNFQKNNNNFYYCDLFKRFNSYTIFVVLFDYLFKNITQLIMVSEEDPYEAEGILFSPLIALLEIIHRTERRLIAENVQLLESGMLNKIIDLFSNTNLVRFLCEYYPRIFAKLIRVFYEICSKFLWIENKSNFLENKYQVFKVLRQTKEIIKPFFDLNEVRSEYTIFLITLSFLQEKYLTNESEEMLVEENEYDVIAAFSFVESFFNKVSNDFEKFTDIIKWEFINENNQLEVGHLIRLNFVRISKNANIRYDNAQAPSIVRIINALKLYGNTIEKIISIDCLENFCEVKEVRQDLLNDVLFMESVKKYSLITNCGGNLEPRLVKISERFLNNLNNLKIN